MTQLQNDCKNTGTSIFSRKNVKRNQVNGGKCRDGLNYSKGFCIVTMSSKVGGAMMLVQRWFRILVAEK
jgi:hypothetical protein